MALKPLVVGLLALTITELAICQQFEKTKSVWIEPGLVRGRIYKIGEEFLQLFLGIPYAEPPVGELRLRLRVQKPVKRGRWHKEYDATEYKSPCVQFMDFHRHDKYSGENMKRQSEDCLHLNIFAPYDPVDETKTHPVMLWIHGGSFLAGSADTGIDMEVTARNIIFNGFMSQRRADGTRTGNYGIWDQVLVLEWIQANIKQFNGDPEQVTVIGESAGAAAVSVLAISPVTQGLVHRAIAMSGSSTAGWAINRHGTPDWDVANVAAHFRCKKAFKSEDMVAYLRQGKQRHEHRLEIGETTDGEFDEECPVKDLSPKCLDDLTLNDEQLLNCFRDQLNLTAADLAFRRALTVELGVSSMVVDDELIPAFGVDFVRNGSRVPLMTGVARREWAHKKPLFYNYIKAGELSEEITMNKVRHVVGDSFHKSVNAKLPNATLDLIGNATYFEYMTSRNKNNSWDTLTFVRLLQDLEADLEFVAPAQREIDAYASGNLPVYAYSFDYVPQSDLVEDEEKNYDLFGQDSAVVVNRDVQFQHAFHGLDHGFIFTDGYSSNYQIKQFTGRDKRMSKQLCFMITNFVKTGNPTPEPYHGFVWRPYTSTEPTYALLDVPPSQQNGELHWPVPSFWNKHIQQLTKYTGRKGEYAVQDVTDPLTQEERVQLNAYKRAWWALWLLVAAIAIALWTVIICLVVRKCTSPRAKPYDNIVVTNNR